MQQRLSHHDRPQHTLKITTLTLVLILCTSVRATSAQQTGFLQSAQWIAAPSGIAQPTAALPLFRRPFAIRKPIQSATLMISGLGQFEAHLNGRNVTTAVLTPGWTTYTKRILYDTYDVTGLLHPGDNTLGVMLGNGMYNLLPVSGRYTKIDGPFRQPRLIAALTIVYRDASSETIVTDNSWQVAAGPITLSSAYGGEDYDARRELPGWDMPGTTSGVWHQAAQIESPGGHLEPETSPPVRPFEAFTPTHITHPSPHTTIYDLGQNMAGWPEIAVQGRRGAHVRLLAGELLDAKGLVTQRSATAFPNAANLFTYTLRGGPPERWHPRFSYYGFRYIQVDSTGGDVKILHLAGRVLHDDISTDGTFTSSSQLLNGIHRIIDRAILSNLFSVITDCPHREKLGWLEQTHLAGSSLMYNYGLASLYAKISEDMQDAQTPDGLIPDIAPEFDIFPGPFRDSPEWGSAVVLSPWIAYQFYGDLAPLATHYDSMQRYAVYLNSRSHDGLLTFGLGDWYDIGPGDPGPSKLTSPGVTATATYFELLTALAHIATLLHKPGDAAHLTQQAASVRDAFNARFFHPDTNQYDTGSQTANAMPLVVGLAPEDCRDAILANLIIDIHAHQDHVTAGDIGFHYVVRALTDSDRSDVLYAMLLRTDPPSYGAQLAQGATTLTEAWDANPTSSQNHFMLGHAEEWFYRGLAGIDLDLSRQSNARLRLHPAIPGDLQHASATFHSTLGNVTSAWQRNASTLRWTLHLPVAATVILPKAYPHLVSINGRPPPPNTASTLLLHPGTYTLHLAPQ